MTSDRLDLTPLRDEPARAAAAEAARHVGVEPQDVELVRLGTRAVFRLAKGSMLARVTAPSQRENALYELRVARWLADAGVPVGRPWPDSELYESGGLAVTLWIYRDGVWATTRELASVLRRLHAVPSGRAPALRQWNPFPEMRQRLSASVVLASAEKAALGTMIETTEAAVGELDFTLPQGVIHGDASVGNIWRTPEDELVLFDLEGVGTGAREWDLIITAVYNELGWHTDREYDEFASEYGSDVRAWPGYGTLAQAQRLRMICWLAGSAVANDDRAIAELRGRVDELTGRTNSYRWQPL